MSSVEITIRLPEELVKRAREFDALTDEVIGKLLEDEVDRRVMAYANTGIHDARRETAFREFRELGEKLSAVQPSLSEEEIAAEVEAARQETEDE
jgi:hypothetical protein